MSKTADAGRKPNVPIVVLAVVALFALVYFVPQFFGGPNIASLQQTALSGATEQEQVRAAQQLGQIGRPALEALRVVSQESQNPGVVSVCILAMSRLYDYDSMDVLLAKLEDDAIGVRSSAATALEKLLGRDYHFPVEGNESERADVRDRIIEDWNLYNGSELFEHNRKKQSQMD